MKQVSIYLKLWMVVEEDEKKKKLSCILISNWHRRRENYIHSMNRGRGGALVESIPFDRRVVGSNPALAAT